MSNDRMDVWEVDVETLATSADAVSTISPIRGRVGGAPSGGCSHAKKAAEQRQKEEVERFLSKERESGKLYLLPQLSTARVRALCSIDICCKPRISSCVVMLGIGIHWGNPEFSFTKDVDMNKLCARVVIYAEKR